MFALILDFARAMFQTMNAKTAFDLVLVLLTNLVPSPRGLSSYKGGSIEVVPTYSPQAALPTKRSDVPKRNRKTKNTTSSGLLSQNPAVNARLAQSHEF